MPNLTCFTMYSSHAGLRVAQVRFLFDLPPQFGRLATTHPLAYVEWFTSLGQPDPLTGMHCLKRSTRNLRRNMSIISVKDIVCAVHLTPKYGSVTDKSLTSENVLETCGQFFFNPYIEVDTFVLSKNLV